MGGCRRSRMRTSVGSPSRRARGERASCVASAHAVAPGALGFVEPGVGGGEELRRARIRGAASQSDADRHLESRAQRVPGMVGDGLAQALAHGTGELGWGIEQSQYEFLAAVASREID